MLNLYDDIYDDTCLHPGVMADEIALNLDPEEPENLSELLENMAILRYRYNAKFREKLKATQNDVDASDKDAADARDWLKATMTQWGNDIVGG